MRRILGPTPLKELSPMPSRLGNAIAAHDGEIREDKSPCETEQTVCICDPAAPSLDRVSGHSMAEECCWQSDEGRGHVREDKSVPQRGRKPGVAHFVPCPQGKPTEAEQEDACHERRQRRHADLVPAVFSAGLNNPQGRDSRRGSGPKDRKSKP